MKRITLGTLSGVLLLVTSCARVELKPREPLPVVIPAEPEEAVPELVRPQPVERHDTIHTVAPGETLWRIAKMYDVDTFDIAKANNITEKNTISMGQSLIIPNAAPLRPVLSLYPSQKWKYIIIHHSATHQGNSLNFHRAHLQRGFDRGIGYHFVIDNGTSGKEDGQIEVTPRWIKQEDGAHCKASAMNYRAIGVCLVGNFNTDTVSEKQMNSLVYLVHRLKEYYHIPRDKILGHGEVEGALTECPGKNFPWSKFYRLLNMQGETRF